MDIVDNSVERRISKKSNLIHIPCENIELNSLFLVHVEIESGRTTFTCTQSPINTYLDILQDKNICSLLSKKMDDISDHKGYDIEEEPDSIIDILHNKVRELRNNSIDILL